MHNPQPRNSIANPQIQMCSGSDSGSYSRLLYHSTVGLRTCVSLNCRLESNEEGSQQSSFGRWGIGALLSCGSLPASRKWRGLFSSPPGLHFASAGADHEPEIRDPKPGARNPKSESRSPKPRARNPQNTRPYFLAPLGVWTGRGS